VRHASAASKIADYSYYYQSEAFNKLWENIQRQVSSMLMEIVKAITEYPIEHVVDYAVSKEEFYDYIAYPVVKRLIEERDRVLEYTISRYGDKKLFKAIVKLTCNIYRLRYLPIYGHERGIGSDVLGKLIEAYQTLFKEEYASEIMAEDAKYLLTYYVKVLPTGFRVKLVTSIYSRAAEEIAQFLGSGDLTVGLSKALEKLSEIPEIVGDQMVDEVIWPRIKHEIDALSEKDPEATLQLIDNLLGIKEFEWTHRESPRYKLKTKLRG